MADLSGLARLNAPVGRESGAQAALRAVYSYLFQQTEQLQYILANLDESNFSAAMAQRLARLEQAASGAAQSLAPQAEAYPVGAVYCCTGEQSPAAALGGQWERIEDYASPSAGTAIYAWQRTA